MKLSSRTTITIIAFFMLAPAFAVAAEHDRQGERGEPARHMERMAERLELTEAQKAEWKALHEAHYPRMRELRGEIRQQRRAMRTAPESEAGEATRQRLEELTAEARDERTRMHARVQEILTEEQREKFAELHARRGEQRHRHGERHKQRGEQRHRHGERHKQRGERQEGAKERSGRDY